MEVRFESRLAKLFLPKKYVAITLGERVYTPLAELTRTTLRHEQAHVEQWRRHGKLRFLALYLWYHVRYGYRENPFEVEARAAEKEARERAGGRSSL